MRYLVECGWETPTAPVENPTKIERGRMVSVLFNSRDELRKRCTRWPICGPATRDGVLTASRRAEPVHFDLPGQDAFAMPLPPGATRRQRFTCSPMACVAGVSSCPRLEGRMSGTVQ
jgi:hypothetical protein